ncbi:uncharacterized protein J3D65DRAFT_398970 [Phyllosticta citribraziliensis]|uniref:SMP domain-containing protein n=1 Tax=Phyllosticta citribraziliensis TaxID=989973 RepID=A0ABR1LLC6_9PEZI
MSSNTNQNTSSSDDTTPSLITSHASYAKGAAEATIGSLTSNAALQHSGDATKSQAVEDMRAANNNSSSSSEAKDGSSSGGAGSGGLAAKAEQAVGGVVGCEGLQAQGKEKEGKVKEA